MLLKIDNLDVAYRSDDGKVCHAARDINLELDRGEVLGLVGESGSGKSSVAMSIARLLPSPPAFYPKGRILLDGEDILGLPVERLCELRGKRVGVVFQDPMGSLSPLHRIGDQLAETILLHECLSRAAARSMAIEWLEKVGIRDPEISSRAYPHELSGGMQQRVMIAMALMLDPDLLIADEPTTALDVTVQAQVLRLMRSLHQSDSAILLITHDLGVVAEMATRIAVMKDGVIVENSASAAKFFENPQHPYSRTLLNESSRFEV